MEVIKDGVKDGAEMEIAASDSLSFKSNVRY